MSAAGNPTREEIRPGRWVHVQRRHVDDATRSAVRLHVIHGAGGRAEQFDPLLDRITAAAPWSAVAFDWLGHGKSERPDGWDYYAADELYADVERVFQQHRTAGTNIVLAHSYGTAMAMRLAANKGALGVPCLRTTPPGSQTPHRSAPLRLQRMTWPPSCCSAR